MEDNTNYKKDIKTLSKAMIFYMLLSSVSVTLIAMMLYARGYIEDDALLIGNTLGMSIVSVFVLQYYTKRLNVHIPYKLNRNKFSVKSFIKYAVVCLGLFWGSNLIFSYLMELCSSFIIFETPDFSPNSNLITNLFNISYSIMLAPLFEELIFRGMLFGKLKEYGNVFAIVVVSLLFALLHGNLPQSIPTFFFSIGLCVLTLKSNSILPAIAVHIIGNTIGMLGMALTQPVVATILRLIILTVIVASIVLHKMYMKKHKLTSRTKEQHRAREYFTNWASITYAVIGILNMIMMIKFK